MMLSVLLPARKEQFLRRTVEDLLAHSEAETEVIAGLDGEWADPPLEQHPRVTVVYHPVSIGQRAACNEAAKLARGKYVAKCDAHCSFDQGWDRKMLEAFAEAGDDVTMVPVMKNLHAFSWKCQGCGKETYQGPRPEGCDACDINSSEQFDQEVKWIAKPSPNSTAYRFDTNLRFNYFGELKERQKGDLAESLSLQGSFFMLTKERYFALDICDESWGNWGQQGTEVALKTWLSGGRVICNRRTWYAHLFRTQKGFSFPWGGDARSQQNAIEKCQDTFLNNRWPLQKYPLSWLIEKFKPVPDWHEASGAAALAQVLKAGQAFEANRSAPHPVIILRRNPSKQVLYYSHGGSCPPKVLEAVRKQITRGIKEKHVLSVSPEPLAFGHNLVHPRVEGKPPWMDMFERILLGLEAATADVIYFAEQDVLYHKDHYAFVPSSKTTYYYNTHVYRVRYEDGHALKVDDCKQLSGICAYRTLLLDHFRERLRRVKLEGFKRGNGYEPGTRDTQHGGYDDFPAEAWSSEFPNLDIRHGGTMTSNRWSREQFRNPKYTEGWTETNIRRIRGWEGIEGMIG